MTTIKINTSYHAEYRGNENGKVEQQLEGSIRKTHERGVVYDHFPNMPRSFSLFAEFESAEARDAFIAAFPKYCGIIANKYGTMARLRSTITFYADDANKGVNEAGIKRVRKIIEIARQLGHDFGHNGVPALNSYETVDDFLAVL